MAIVSLPDVDLFPDQYPDAEQDDALELFQDMTVESPCITVVGFAVIDAVAWGGGVVPPPAIDAVLGVLEPPPPPPHAERSNTPETSSTFFIQITCVCV